MKNSKVIVLLCGLISVTATIIFYLFTFHNIFTVPMRWVSLLFLLIAEVIGTVKACTGKSTIFGQVINFTSIAHVLVVLGMSIVFVNLFPLHLKMYILLNILLLCVMAVVDIVSLFFGNHTSAADQKLASNQAVMESCYAKAKGMELEYGQGRYKKELTEIVELIKYSDNSGLTGDEMNIFDRLGELESLLKEEAENVSDKIVEIINVIRTRSIKLGNQKRGGY